MSSNKNARDYFAEFDATDEAKYEDPKINDRFNRVLECAEDMRHELTIGEALLNMRAGKTAYNQQHFDLAKLVVGNMTKNDLESGILSRLQLRVIRDPYGLVNWGP